LHSFQISELKKVTEELAKAKAENQKKEEEQKDQEELAKTFSQLTSLGTLTDVWYRGRLYERYDDEPSRRRSRCGDWKYPCECGDGYTRPG
jgi:hypothetical protein